MGGIMKVKGLVLIFLMFISFLGAEALKIAQDNDLKPKLDSGTYQKIIAFNSKIDRKGLDESQLLDKLIEGYGFEPNQMNRYMFSIALSKILAKHAKNSSSPVAEEGYEELFGNIDTSFDELAHEMETMEGVKKKEEKDTRFFKKRHLFSLLGLLAFLGINIGFFWKLFDWKKNKDEEIEELKKNHERKMKDVLLACAEKIQEAIGESERCVESIKQKVDVLNAAKERQLKACSDGVCSIEEIVHGCQESIDSLDKKIDSVSQKTSEDVLQRCQQSIESMEVSLRQVLDEKAKSVLHQCNRKVDENNCLVDQTLRENQLAVEKTKRDFELQSVKTKENLERITGVMKDHCKMVERCIQELCHSGQESKGFWSSMFSVDGVDLGKGIELIGKLESFSRTIENTMKLFADNSSSSSEGDSLEQRFLELSLPSVPTTRHRVSSICLLSSFLSLASLFMWLDPQFLFPMHYQRYSYS